MAGPDDTQPSFPTYAELTAVLLALFVERLRNDLSRIQERELVEAGTCAASATI